jgi:peptidoglycan/xylan/chitin deacetylase (PgdA/CDA1 family)
MNPVDSCPKRGPELPGALVISLDFELHWGVRDRIRCDEPYGRNLLGAPEAVARLLQLFEEFEVAATWATVGFLFATSRIELQAFTPKLRPVYADPSLSPYEESIGESERDDPLHFAPSLIELIQETPQQEIATHTFSHYYCGEKGQDRETFRADLAAARAIAARRGLQLRSIVFPRNQHNPIYDDILLENGITAYRGNPTSFAWRFADGAKGRATARRAVRLLDTYLSLTGPGTIPWAEVLQPEGLSNVRASCFLRPFRAGWKALDTLRLERIRRSVRYAAQNREIFHLWWHPHNFGNYLEENLNFLRSILEEMERCRREYAMVSLTMNQADQLVRGEIRQKLGVRGNIRSVIP